MGEHAWVCIGVHLYLCASVSVHECGRVRRYWWVHRYGPAHEPCGRGGADASLWVYRSIDGCFMLDMILNFRLGFYERTSTQWNSIVVMDGKRIAWRYFVLYTEPCDRTLALNERGSLP